MSRLWRRDGWRSRGGSWHERQKFRRSSWCSNERTDGFSDDFTGLDVEDDDAMEWVLDVEAMITFVDFGVRGTSCAPIVAVPDEGMTNRSGTK